MAGFKKIIKAKYSLIYSVHNDHVIKNFEKIPNATNERKDRPRDSKGKLLCQNLFTCIKYSFINRSFIAQ